MEASDVASLFKIPDKNFKKTLTDIPWWPPSMPPWKFLQQSLHSKGRKNFSLEFLNH